jgi:hypothetical protein
MPSIFAISWAIVVLVAAPVAGILARRPLSGSDRPRTVIYIGSAINLVVIGAITAAIDRWHNSEGGGCADIGFASVAFRCVVVQCLVRFDNHFFRRFRDSHQIRASTIRDRDVAVAADIERAGRVPAALRPCWRRRRISLSRFCLFHAQGRFSVAAACYCDRDNLLRASARSSRYDWNRTGVCARLRTSDSGSGDRRFASLDHRTLGRGRIQRTMRPVGDGMVGKSPVARIQ